MERTRALEERLDHLALRARGRERARARLARDSNVDKEEAVRRIALSLHVDGDEAESYARLARVYTTVRRVLLAIEDHVACGNVAAVLATAADADAAFAVLERAPAPPDHEPTSDPSDSRAPRQRRAAAPLGAT